MKSGLIKFLSVLVFTVFLTACVGTPFESTQPGFGETYPSQFIVGDVYILKNHEKVEGNIAGIGTTLIIEDGATVMGDISLVASNLEINGRVTGDINVFAGTSALNENAIITGNINQIFNQLKVAPDAVISGKINTYVFPLSEEKNVGEGVVNLMEWLQPTHWIILQSSRALALIMVTLLIVALFKKPTFLVMEAIRKNIAVSWGAGILSMFFIPIIALVLVISICLSPIGLIILIILIICIIWGWASLSFIIGERLAHWLKLNWSDEAVAVIGAVMAGIFLSLFALIPCVGFLINTMITAVGLGGILLSRFGTFSVQ